MPKGHYPRAKVPLETRLWAKVRIGPGCWEWSGSLHKGYGEICVGSRSQRKNLQGHRVAYALAKGPIPDGYQIDHLCRNRRCCNPAHLEAVTPRENTMRGEGPAAKKAQQTVCAHGHPLSIDGRGRRVCRVCKNDYSRRHYEQRRARA